MSRFKFFFMCNEKCCETDCCEAKRCHAKRCQLCALVAMICVSFLVSLGVVKAFAPCVVKHAMMKEYVAKQMEFEMFQKKMVERKMKKKMEMEMMKKGPKPPKDMK